MATAQIEHAPPTLPALPAFPPPELLPGSPRRGPARGRAPVVLVVEHDPRLREQLVSALRGSWLVVDQAADGLAALYALAQRTPDAVILDMDVPEVSGHRVYQVLRQDPPTRRVPVIMIAAGACQEVCPRPDDGPPPECFLRKPVKPDVVLRELARTGAADILAHG